MKTRYLKEIVIISLLFLTACTTLGIATVDEFQQKLADGCVELNGTEKELCSKRLQDQIDEAQRIINEIF